MGSLHMTAWRRRKGGAPRVSAKTLVVVSLLMALVLATAGVAWGLQLWLGTWGPGLIYAGAVVTLVVVRADVL